MQHKANHREFKTKAKTQGKPVRIEAIKFTSAIVSSPFLSSRQNMIVAYSSNFTNFSELNLQTPHKTLIYQWAT
ncbi:hypothetical protein AB833_19960 [Chromatiales bacterium (ex Bugula neritina AB1)]|nr:hypothetical protein AB833_19960 [Chromatiales bacterium (ex Bugula neritina AB1)]